MALIKIAYRNLARRKRRTALLFALIASIMALMVVAGSAFSAAGKGLEASFRGSLTADMVVGAATDGSASIFGDETPIVSEYAAIPPIPRFAAVLAAVAAAPGVAVACPQVTAAAALQAAEGPSSKVFAFGVDPALYARACPDLRFGGPLPAADAPFILLNDALRASIESGLGRPLAPGEKLTLSIASRGSFRIRTVPYAGSYSYPAPSQALDRVALIDPVTARMLDGYDLGFVAKDAPPAAAPPAGDPLAGVFDSAPSVVDAAGGGISLEDVEKVVKTAAVERLAQGKSLDWNYILVKFAPGAGANGLRGALAGLGAGGGLRLLGWVEAAGFAAQGIVAVMAIFYAGMAVIVVGALAILMNSFAITVNERRAEIGGMRAIGATRGFVRELFALEALLLVAAAAACGIALGWAAAAAIGAAGIELRSDVLAALFGGRTLATSVDFPLVALHFLGALAAGALALPYPLRFAMRAKPASAMGTGGEI